MRPEDIARRQGNIMSGNRTRQRRLLAQLDERSLKDVGINRIDAFLSASLTICRVKSSTGYVST
jgi:uncharacterized protein YjiS (DUF1127 family)